eukprot:573796_1
MGERTTHNRSYHCIHQDVDITEHSDSGVVLFERHYLSGFIFRFDEIIEAISLAFARIDDGCTMRPTSSPTASPTAPTQSPISIVYPSVLFGFETASQSQSSVATTKHTVT